MEDDRPPPKFRTKLGSQFAKLEPQPQQYIDGFKLFPKHELTVMSGPGSGGKTQLMLQLGAAWCYPAFRDDAPNWLGRPVQRDEADRCRTLFVSAEEDALDDGSLHHRLWAIAGGERFDLAYLTAFKIIDLVNLTDDRLSTIMLRQGKTGMVGPTHMMKLLEDEITAHNADLVILDNRTYLAAVNLLDQNAALAVNQFFRRLCFRHGCTVVLLTHPSLSGMANSTGSSGSLMSIFAARNFLYMKHPEKEDFIPHPDDGKRVLMTTKVNNGPGGEVNMQWQFGRYVCTDPEIKPDDGIGAADKAERVFMRMMETAQERGTEVSANIASAKTYAPNYFFEHGDRKGLTKPQLNKAMLALLDRKVIEVINVGSRSRPKKLLVIAERKYGNATPE